MAAKYRIAQSLQTLLAEVNKRWPKRSKRSDGALGDAAHASRKSDHNPWLKDAAGVGVVRARDFTAEGVDMGWLREHLRMLGALGDKRLQPQGYVISEGEIAGAGTTAARWKWRKYNGPNQHRLHLHISVTETAGAAGYDSIAAWGLDGSHALRPTEASYFKRGDRGEGPKFIQAMLNILAAYRLPKSGKGIGAQLALTGVINAPTEEAIREFQRWNNRFLIFVGEAPNIKEDGIAGPVVLELIAKWVAVVFDKPAGTTKPKPKK